RRMFGRSKIVWLKTYRGTQSVTGAAMLTLFLAIFMTLVAGEAKACPPGMAFTKASLAHKLKAKVFTDSMTVVVTAGSPHKVGGVPCSGGCCGGAPPS